jgi:hypothetical protein
MPSNPTSPQAPEPDPASKQEEHTEQTPQTVQTPEAPAGGFVSSGPPPDWRKSAVDFLGDSTKQLITVATGIVTVTLVFSKDLLIHARFSVLAAWILLTISIVFGICTLYMLSGVIYEAATKNTAPKLTAGDLRFCSGAQIIFFVLGVVAMVLFACIAVYSIAPSENKPITVNCVVPAAPPPVVIHEPCPQLPEGVKGRPCKNLPVHEK